jgi:NAD-dependent SIR2 family protein deacetylase
MTEQKTKIKPHCRRCGVEISQDQEDQAIKDHWIPLCAECEPEIKEKAKKWWPLFQKFRQ